MSNSLSRHLDGHVPLDHALSPHWQFKKLPWTARLFSDYTVADLWNTDFGRLPRPLRAIRRRAKVFADRHIVPRASTLDLAPHLAPGQCHPEAAEILRLAGLDGWLDYMAPRPVGSASLYSYAYPIIWTCSLVVEEFTRACGGIMLLLSAHHLGAMPILLSGDLGHIFRFLGPVYRSCRAGEPHLMAFAITEPGAGSDAEDGHGAAAYRPGVVATPTERGYLLNGRKCYISGGDLAKSMTVFAALQGEGMESWTCFYVQGDAPGLKVARTELKMGMRASGAAELEFTNVFVPANRIIGGLRKGWALNRATLNSSRIPVASMGVGFARAATEAAIDFARTYRLGGKPLISYQEIQLQIATMTAETRALRSLIWQEASHARQPRQLLASLCKFHATDRAQKVCEMALDMMGDHASLHENRIEKILRDVRLTRIFEGTNDINRLSLIEDWQGQLVGAGATDPVGV